MRIQGLNLKKALQWSDVGSEVVVLDPDMGEVLRLNPVAGFIWQQLNEGQTAEEIAEAVSQEFATEKKVALRDVEDFLQELVNLELLQ